MGLESATWVDDLTNTNPISNDLRSQGDDHLRLLKSVLRTTFPRAGKPFPFHTALSKAADYTILSTDEHTFFTGDGTSATVALTLPSLASGDKGWYCVVRASDLTHAVTLVGTVNGVATYTFGVAGQTIILWWSGTAWFAFSDKIVDIVNLTALTAPAVDDSLSIYDLSATANRKIALSDFFKTINALAAETGPAVDDTIALYDTSESAANTITLANLLKVLNLLDEDATPDGAADFLLSYDTSASVVKKVKPDSILPAPDGPKAWVTWTQSGTVVTVQASFNVTSVVRNSAGDYTVTFTSEMADVYYALASTVQVAASNNIGSFAIKGGTSPSTTVVELVASASGVPTDVVRGSVIVFGN